MSKNINQVFTANPITTNQSTDLMYFGRSPYGATNDTAMTYANFALQFGAPYTAAALTSANDTNVTLTLGGTPTTALLQAASITAGWTGQLSLTRGGTNASLTASNGGIFYSTASAGAILAGTATANQVLLSGSNTTPAWSTATYPATTTINQILYSSAANTITGLATANSSTIVTSSTGVPSFVSAMTNGQMIIGSTGATPVSATLTAGTNVSITNAAGSITINNTAPAGITNVNQNSSSVNLAPESRYAINNGASLVTLTLATSPSIGDTYIIVGGSSGGWKVAQNASQQCHIGSTATTSGTGGSLASTNQYDCITITCVATNTFTVYAVEGNITVV